MTLLGTVPTTTYMGTDLPLNCTKGPGLLSNTERTITEFNFKNKVNVFMTCQIKSCKKRMLHAMASTIFKCHSCRGTQRVKSATKNMSARLSAQIDGEPLWLTAFADVMLILMKKANVSQDARSDKIAAALLQLENISLKINTQSNHILSVLDDC